MDLYPKRKRAVENMESGMERHGPGRFDQHIKNPLNPLNPQNQNIKNPLNPLNPQNQNIKNPQNPQNHKSSKILQNLPTLRRFCDALL